MQTPLRALVRRLVEQGIDQLRSDGTLPDGLASPEFVVERPKDRSHGDFSSNVAMLLAKPAKSNPRALAQALVAALLMTLLPSVPASAHGTSGPTLNQCDWTATPSSPVAESYATIEYVFARCCAPECSGENRAATRPGQR